MKSDTAAVREQVRRALAWEDAHVGFDRAIDGIPAHLRGKKPEGLPYSLWQILEHMRRAQADILDFCVNPKYKELRWPEDYWPAGPAPASAAVWNQSIRKFRRDRKALQKLASNPKVDLTSKIPHGQGQTYLRELILAADHAAYHIGELIVIRRLLGIWS